MFVGSDAVPAIPALNPEHIVCELDRVWLEYAKDRDFSKLVLPIIDLALLRSSPDRRKRAAERLLSIYEAHGKRSLGIK